ncbi:nuclease-related domain-containing protein [Oceanobacillus chungangensis]|uniref:NERD domain-containing protein n=1 Tax=Oceanobacillus chungangensis TaxID=1229152 RepID=A0A3D8PZH5_9BACI|nr:nuclease-related domain-containing protein [Oceanobacillus chungangensis]RDW20738.1 hypothetical protein CWR45_05805 [Oceanobacillus chungangensis]
MKNRMKPLVLQKYEVLAARVAINSPKRAEIDRELAKYHRGYAGELRVDYHLNFLASIGTILQDVCLNVNGQTVQIDNIVITKRAIYLIEVINYHGTVTFDTNFNQFIRSDGERETGFSYPITQVELQMYKLQNWLHSHGFQDIPIYYFIAISEPATIIKVEGDKHLIANIVAHGENIPKKIIDNEKQLAVSKSISIPHQKIGHALLRESIDYDRNIMAVHGLKISDLLPGVRCLNCSRFRMNRERRNWHCHKCKHISKNAHIKTINDHFLLTNPWTTNKEMMHLLQVGSRHVVKNLLKQANLIYNVKKKKWTRRI